MKNIFKSFLIAAAVVAVACNPEGPTDKTVPQFPESKEYNVTPGSTLDINFSANMDWELSVPESSLQWFWLQDGSFKLYKVNGKAGDQTVTIGVSATEEFDVDRTCDVTLKMGGKEQVIAKLVRSSKDQTLTLYAAVVADGEIQFKEDGSGYLYEETVYLKVTSCSVCIKEVVDERSLKSCTLTLVNRESCSCKLYAEIEVDDVVLLGKVPVRKIVLTKLRNLVTLLYNHIVLCTFSFRNLVTWDIWKKNYE